MNFTYTKGWGEQYFTGLIFYTDISVSLGTVYQMVHISETPSSVYQMIHCIFCTKWYIVFCVPNNTFYFVAKDL